MVLVIIRALWAVIRDWIARSLFLIFFPEAKITNGGSVISIPFHIRGVRFTLDAPYGMDYMDTHEDLSESEARGYNINIPRLIYDGQPATITPPPKGGELSS